MADVKRFKVMSGNKVSTAKQKEKELDCVLGLHNLHHLLNMDSKFDLPPRRNAIVGEHIFHPLVPPGEVDLHIPPAITPSQEKNMTEVLDFQKFLPSAAAAIKRALGKDGNDHIFFPNVDKRGKNLYDGAYVLHLRVQREESAENLDLWTVEYLVGASYSYETYKGYFQMRPDLAVVANICQCYSG